jgi:hypothetical protein
MAKKPEPPTPIIWNACKIAGKAVWLGAGLTDELVRRLHARRRVRLIIQGDPPALPGWQ